jgi:hypothetical protein
MLERHRRGVRSWTLGCGSAAVGLIVVGAVFGLGTGLPAWLAAVPLAVGAWLAISVIAGAADARVVRLVPYFRESVPGPFTLTRGRALLRASGVLEQIARGRGVAPLTEFLGEDPLAGGSVEWHEAGRAVATLDALIAALPDHRASIPDYENVMTDCREWRARMAEASERGVPFFVMMRAGNTISGHEMSLRGGSF